MSGDTIRSLFARLLSFVRDLIARIQGCRLEPPLPLIPRWVRRMFLAGGFLAVALLAAIFARYIKPPTPKQPIPFSHRFHVQTKGLQCMFCHNSAPRSSVASLPAVDKCLLCHDVIVPRFWPIKRLHDYYNTGKPVPWRWVNRVPDYVRFSHEAHITERIDCGHCHGDVAAMDRVQAAHRFDMNFCITCHWRRNVSTSCFRCHY